MCTSATIRTTSLIDTSSSSGTDRMMGSDESYSSRTLMNSLARSREKMNCRSGDPEPHTVRSSPFSASVPWKVDVPSCELWGLRHKNPKHELVRRNRNESDVADVVAEMLKVKWNE